MKRLSGLDAAALHAETSSMPTHTVGVAVLDPAESGFDAGTLHRLLCDRLGRIPSYRRRVVMKPLGLGNPVWVDDPRFDVTGHVQRSALPSPGGDRELGEFVGSVFEQVLDRDRPLWRAWTLEGLAGGRIAVVVKMSHAVVDGVGGVESILPELLTPEPRALSDIHAATAPAVPDDLPPLPSTWRLLNDSLQELAGDQVVAWRVGSALVSSGSSALAGVVTRPFRPSPTPRSGPPSPPVPRTALNGSLTSRRSLAFASLSLDAFLEVARAHGVTVNDVLLAVCAGALRTWHERHDRVPDAPLGALVPISVRATTDSGGGGGEAAADNQYTMAVVRLPVHIDEPDDRVTWVHRAMQRLKGRGEGSPEKPSSGSGGPSAASMLPDIIQLLAPPFVTESARLYVEGGLSQWHAPLAHAVVSNIPGPPHELYCGPARVASMFACGPLFEGLGINITAVSHAGVFDVSLGACTDIVPDPSEITESLAEELARLHGGALADERRPRV